MKSRCRNCGRRLIEEWSSAWVHINTQMMLCDVPEGSEPQSFYADPVPEGVLVIDEEESA